MFTNHPSIDDIPYWTSKPIQFVYESTAVLSGGLYTWADSPSDISPLRPIKQNFLYIFRSITLSADIAEGDFTANITTTPKFNLYLQQMANASILREPLQMVKYFEDFQYPLAWTSQADPDKLLASFTGVLQQGSALIGKASITLKGIISATEVVDEAFIRAFKKRYPVINGGKG